ncbi:MAG: hypoxanthine phosphoribosyltransferase [Candidatus Krumholzibacteriota bacterium]|nr:hypoxanthine phosphoribosyltransferase [Candidatus Krumholzibacteriota bacterium]
MLHYKELISADDIQRRVSELAREISSDYPHSNPLLVTLLKGAFIFLADLVRQLSIPHEIDFITLSSYKNGSRRSEAIEVINHLRSDIDGRDIIIIDEIADTGRTLSQLMKTLSERRIRSLRICTLLNKPSAREVEIPVHYTGFEIPDLFVVGYGLDYREQYRNLPCIVELTQHLKQYAIPPRKPAKELKTENIG